MQKLMTVLSLVMVTRAAIQTTCKTVTNVLGQKSLLAGRIDSDDNLRLGYFVYYPSTTPSSQHLLVFIGPPGITSMNYNLRGVGPSLLTDDGQFIQNPNSFADFAHLLFLDLYGAGYSRSPNSEQVTPQQLGLITSDYIKSIATTCGFNLKVTIVSSNIGAKVATFAATHLTADLIMISPLMVAESLIRYLPQIAFSFGLIDQQERVNIERQALQAILFGVTYEKYSALVNLVAKYGGNVNIHNFFSVKTNTDQIAVARVFNSETVRAALNIDQGQTFYGQNPQQLMRNAFPLNDTLQTLADLASACSIFSKSQASTKVLFVINQQSLTTNYRGTMAWLKQFHWTINQVTHSFSDTLTKWSYDPNGENLEYSSNSIGNFKLFTVFQSGEYIWQDQPKAIYEIVQAHLQ